MALHARKYHVSEKKNQSSTKRTNSYLRKNVDARKCLLWLEHFTARKYLRIHRLATKLRATASRCRWGGGGVGGLEVCVMVI